MTKIFSIKSDDYNKILNECSEIIKTGGTVCFPTETVYGLGVNGLDKNAVAKIFKAKGRPSDNPLILHISNLKMINDISISKNDLIYKLAEKFWPGPLTIILKKSNLVPDEVTAGLDTVAIRMPKNRFALDLISHSNLPIAAPSANLSGKPSPTKAMHCINDMNNRVDAIVDGGDTLVGLESTVLDLSSQFPTILRPGAITFEELKEYIKNLKIDSALFDDNSKLIPKSPGQKYRHYAPNAEAVLFVGAMEKKIKNIAEYKNNNKSKNIVYILSQELAEKLNYDKTLILGSSKDLNTIAQNIFKLLREADDLNADLIIIEGFEEKGVGLAVMNRLKKACSYKIIGG
ncbi:MAG: L-threonylcarbamoyladenylate synthase [Tissierellia bacterium]|nr:L-threonylcarbamoyladenylate synthase [Tissierellia bacterium]